VLPVRTIARITVPVLAAAALTLPAAAPAGGSTASCPWNGVQPTAGPWLNGVAALPDCQAFAVGGLSGSVILHLSDGSWQQQASPSPGNNNTLAAVAATSAANAWAVGNYQNYGDPYFPQSAEILQWNGTAWSEVTTPQPGGSSGQTELAGVAATSAANAWAVGSWDKHSPHRTFIVHWNGTSWSQVPSPDPGGPHYESRLTAVSVVSATDAWAVGWYRQPPRYRRTLILHWNGVSWTQVPSPDGPTRDGLLFGVAFTSARNGWAIGHSIFGSAPPLILHWNGSTWSIMRVPAAGELNAITATSARNAWAVGSGVILHWNGTAWSVVPGQAQDLYAVSASSAGNAWAVGVSHSVEPPASYPLVAHWNGTSWQP
jgi:hypothetical protein